MAVNIAKLLAKGLGNKKELGFQSMQLRSIAPGVPGADLLAGNQPVETPYTCKGAFATKRNGFWQFWQNAQAGGTARATFVSIAILGGSLKGVEPKAGDKIVVKGVTYTISADGVTADQVNALYVCQCRAPGR